MNYRGVQTTWGNEVLKAGRGVCLKSGEGAVLFGFLPTLELVSQFTAKLRKVHRQPKQHLICFLMLSCVSQVHLR